MATVGSSRGSRKEPGSGIDERGRRAAAAGRGCGVGDGQSEQRGVRGWAELDGPRKSPGNSSAREALALAG